jgi:hypothetical protein
MLETIQRPEVLWPTTTLSVEVQNYSHLNPRLAEIILEHERRVRAALKTTPAAEMRPDAFVSNVLKWDHPEIREFRQLVLQSVRDYLALVGDPDDPEMKITGINCWANVMRFGEGLPVHHHDPAFVSGHYQVRSGGNGEVARAVGMGDSGNTVYFRPGFMDRCHGVDAAVTASNLWDEDWRVSVPAEEGRLFLFPSYVRHEVRPYMGNAERISIGVDVFVKKQRSLINFRSKRWYIPE